MIAKRNNKVLSAVVTLISLAAVGEAYAQNSVTLYGRLVGGVGYLNKIAQPGGDTADTFRYAPNWGTSWWGLRAQEDLGGGLSAVMNLESGFSTDAGSTGTSLFNRYAYVGVASKTFGALWLGRAMGLPDSEISALDPMGYQNTSLATLANGRIWGSRANTVTYNSPSWGGFSFRGQFGLNGTAGQFNSGKQIGGSVSYQNGPLVVKGVYEEIRDADGGFNSLYTASRLYATGVVYQVGDVKMYGGYALTRSGGNTVATADNPTAANKQELYWLGANYQATPALQLIGGVYRANRNNSGGNGTLLAVGANYYFSKRTMFYATVGHVMNGGNAAFTSEAGDNRPLQGSAQQGVYTGMVHWF
ncbi:porin [Cupriavidus consociatus]|uniref:porin n=1 Tax=Cupriavidus consociatus TaxID=2821357 RepID=UPI001AEB53CA|nr:MULTISPECIES: porin [unclassified Cupriavidus]MBP0624798.1 porin [Cupriavidus sp. LEh25]MDK2661520.1 porin [Cupriavidus sp. LEh21]